MLTKGDPHENGYTSGLQSQHYSKKKKEKKQEKKEKKSVQRVSEALCDLKTNSTILFPQVNPSVDRGEQIHQR